MAEGHFLDTVLKGVWVHRRNTCRVLCVCFLFVCIPFSFAQMKEEKEEKDLREKIIESQKARHAIDMQTALVYGYDSNVNLDGARKGDSFEELALVMRMKQPFVNGVEFDYRYSLDVRNYSQITDASNILHQMLFECSRYISIFKVGVGYDLAYLAYPDFEEGDFLFHKGFCYIGNDLTRKLSHQLKVYYGVKDYLDGKTLSETSLAVDPAKDRLDRRQHAAYLITYSYNKNLTVRLEGNYSINDSNARYIDYYDYKSPGVSCGFDYRIKPDFYLLTDYSYRRKNYKGRTVTGATKTYKQEDNIYAVNVGLLYLLGKQSSLSFNYLYRETSSNDSLSEYTESVVTGGWRYRY